jgi:hypothetical protein
LGLLRADLTIVDALNLGDKLQSILYYHFLPQAYSGAQLAAARSLGTDLGVSTGAPYNVSFTQAPGGPVRACLIWTRPLPACRAFRFYHRRSQHMLVLLAHCYGR